VTKLLIKARIAATRFLSRNEEGATFTEYGLLILGVALVAFIGAQLLGSALSTMYGTTIAGTL
jgi:Flp pilus assembly pilin Flp